MVHSPVNELPNLVGIVESSISEHQRSEESESDPGCESFPDTGQHGDVEGGTDGLGRSAVTMVTSVHVHY